MPTCPTCGGWFNRADLAPANDDPEGPRDRCPDDGAVVGWGSLSPEARAAVRTTIAARQAAREARTPDELEAEKARDLRYVSQDWDDGVAMIFLWVITLAIALMTGVVLLVVFVVVGLSPWAAVAGTVIGVLLGAVWPIFWGGADYILSRLVRLGAESRRVREAGRTAFDVIFRASLVLPAAITVVTSLWLS